VAAFEFTYIVHKAKDAQGGSMQARHAVASYASLWVDANCYLAAAQGQFQDYRSITSA
jgi:hypothetical protein